MYPPKIKLSSGQARAAACAPLDMWGWYLEGLSNIFC
jgi:hypothetical protein